MKLSRHLSRWALFAVLALGVSDAGCGSIPVNPDGGGYTCTGDWGATPEAQRLGAFFRAASDFATQADRLDMDIRTACTRLAMDLGAPASELQATGTMTATQVACTRAAQLVRAEIAAVRAAAGVQIDVGITPPVCRVAVDAFADCVGRCDVTVRPGVADIRCEGGELRGTCSGSCTGSCAVMATAMCSGRCEGTCSASCTGTCSGRCMGTCATRAADGSCNGACTGTCEGTCSAGCTGMCQGSCVAMASATCMGECRGMCSAMWTAPRCTGRVIPPMVNADCQASCEARVNATADCTPARVVFNFTGISAMDLQMRATRLATALTNSYGNVLTAAAQLARLVQAGAGMVAAAANVPNAIVSLGAGAVFCAGVAAAQTTQAVAKVNVSVEVSVMVTGSVG